MMGLPFPKGAYGATDVVWENPMTIDKSLKVRKGLIKNRSVLTRAERIAKLTETERWKEGDPVLGLPKVRVTKLTLKKKKKAKKEEASEEESES
jgi:small basic protein (TIGR04137 family)